MNALLNSRIQNNHAIELYCTWLGREWTVVVWNEGRALCERFDCHAHAFTYWQAVALKAVQQNYHKFTTAEVIPIRQKTG